ncbi:alpha-phosphoglucomutase [Marininema mesophilum]|uniref:Phosphoglucomutase n=1 Tax=Marininema mesophilum TaxID=1048340 RepID=A0A1H2Q684_9BACL|nr:phospho-sugar mutase [Marininema mesophilum]SDW02676.1 alpha-phosphoglucomutase [Marininema mesophilum]
MNEHYNRWLHHRGLDPDLMQELLLLSQDEIEDCFYRHLDFGTAGMRGLLGPGINRMNLYTVRRVTEGLARTLIAQGDDTRKRGVAIAYDSRRFSPEFGAEAAGTLASHSVRVYLYPSLRPTPMLSYAVRHLGAAAGIMITASHNPASYNGYKVYGSDGAQMPPHRVDKILQALAGIDELALPSHSLQDGIASGWIKEIGSEVDTAYYNHVLSLSHENNATANQQLKVIFTPLHGTGNRPVRHILGELGFTQVHTVSAQETPDPDFPTVSAPNPEEHDVFTLALTEAEQYTADIVIGTDPDADRLGLYARNPAGNYTAFNGNQIGALLLHYTLERKAAKGELSSQGIVLKSIVTSEMGRSIASSFGVKMEDTLTGFKYIAEKVDRYEALNTPFLFGYEESYGYLLGSFVRDKDAIQAAMMCCEMAAYYKQAQNLTLTEVLEILYQQHGAYIESIFSFTFQGKKGLEKMSTLMDTLRNQPLKQIADLPIAQVKDYRLGIDHLPKANVLKYLCTDNSWVAIRPSGTEPKIKFYISAVADIIDAAQEKKKRMEKDLRDRLETSL